MVNCKKSGLEIILSLSSKKDWWIPPQDRDPGCCLYPRIPGTNSWGMGVAEGATQAETGPGLPSAQRGSSRDPVTREETWTRSASYRFKTWWNSRVSSQQSENIVYVCTYKLLCILTILHASIINPYVMMCFFQGIKSGGVALHALILCPHTDDKLSCLKHSHGPRVKAGLHPCTEGLHHKYSKILYTVNHCIILCTFFSSAG